MPVPVASLTSVHVQRPRFATCAAASATIAGHAVIAAAT